MKMPVEHGISFVYYTYKIFKQWRGHRESFEFILPSYRWTSDGSRMERRGNREIVNILRVHFHGKCFYYYFIGIPLPSQVHVLYMTGASIANRQSLLSHGGMYGWGGSVMFAIDWNLSKESISVADPGRFHSATKMIRITELLSSILAPLVKPPLIALYNSFSAITIYRMSSV